MDRREVSIAQPLNMSMLPKLTNFPDSRMFDMPKLDTPPMRGVQPINPHITELCNKFSKKFSNQLSTFG